MFVDLTNPDVTASIEWLTTLIQMGGLTILSLECDYVYETITTELCKYFFTRWIPI